MDAIDKLFQVLLPLAEPMFGQTIMDTVQEQAVTSFYSTLEILTNQNAHSEDEVLTAMVVNAALMPRKFWLQVEDYHSERGLEKLKQMKQLLDAKIKAYGRPWETPIRQKNRRD